MDLKASPRQGLNKAEAGPVRPTRTLSRRDTQREAKQNPQVFVDRWETGPFADVPEKRVMGMGPKIFTEAHEDLLRRMRMEGARVSQGMAEAQREAILIHQQHQETWRKLQNTRGELHATQGILEKTQEELRDAQAVLDEMDNAWAQSQHHRMSRVLAIDQIKGADKAKLVDIPSRTGTPDLYPVAPKFAEANETAPRR
jgi:septal ring factor EnvC (AmiA/AmiB activator)